MESEDDVDDDADNPLLDDEDCGMDRFAMYHL